MRKCANNYQIQNQEQQQMLVQPHSQQPSHPPGIYHNGTWYSPLGYESQHYTGSRPLPYNQPPQSFHDGAYPTHVESGNKKPYSLEPDNIAQSSSSGRSSASAQDEQQQQQIYYYQPYDYQQAQQVYQVQPVRRMNQVQQVPQYQVVPPALPQHQPSCQQPYQQPSQRIRRLPTQQTSQRTPQQMNTFQRYRDEPTLTPRSESSGSNVIEIALTDSCDVYISRVPAKLVINITSSRVQDRYEAPNYIIRSPPANMQNQNGNYERFEHESEFSFAGDTDESYNEEYSNSEESHYMPEQWGESPTDFLQPMKPNLLPQQGFETEPVGHDSGDRNPPKQLLQENEYDQFRAPRRVVHHNPQPMANVPNGQHNVISLKETNALQEISINLNNQVSIAMEQVEVEEIVPRNLESLPPALQINPVIVEPIPGKRNTPIVGVCLPEGVVSQHDGQDTLISNNSTKCEQESLQNISENAENQDNNTKLANALPEETEKESTESQPKINNVPEQIEIPNVIEMSQRAATLNNIESELGKSFSKLTPHTVKTVTNGALPKTNLKIKSKKIIPKKEVPENVSLGRKASIKLCDVAQISKEGKKKLSKNVLKVPKSLAQPEIADDKRYKAKSETVIEPVCYKILNISSPEVDQVVVPSTCDEPKEAMDIKENVKIENTAKRRLVQSSESDISKQSNAIPETIDNVSPRANGSQRNNKLAGNSNAERTEKKPLDVVPKKSPKNSSKGKKAEACQINLEKVNESTCQKIQSISSPEVEQVVTTADAPKVVPKSNSKRRKNKKNNVMDSIPVESEPIQPFGCQQATSVKKGANKLSKLERKALRRVKESLKELQSKEQAKELKLPEIPQEEEQQQQQAESESDVAQVDEPEVQAAPVEEIEHSVLKNITDAQLRRTLMRIIDKINYL